MKNLSIDDVTELLQSGTSPNMTAVTMYIPVETSASPPHISQNQIRFKNMIHQAQNELKTRGDESQLSKHLGALLDKYHDDMDFWKSQSRALLICANQEFIKLYRLPVDTEEYVSVDDSFHLAPVLALLGDNKEFYVLALAQQHPKFFKGDMHGLEPIDIGLPASMRSGLGIDEANQQSENQGSANGSSLNTGWFNGRGGARDPQDNDRMRLWHMIDKLVLDKTDRSIPLMLAGIDSEIAEYRAITKYPHLLISTMSGNHTETTTHELHTKAWNLVHQELVLPEHAAAREEYERLTGANPGRVARELDTIETAADQGRIEKLLAMMSRNTTDTVQDDYTPVYRITFPEGGQSKLVNKLAVKVWQMSGKVISLLPHEMPHGAPMVARLRY